MRTLVIEVISIWRTFKGESDDIQPYKFLIPISLSFSPAWGHDQHYVKLDI